VYPYVPAALRLNEVQRHFVAQQNQAATVKDAFLQNLRQSAKVKDLSFEANIKYKFSLCQKSDLRYEQADYGSVTVANSSPYCS